MKGSPSDATCPAGLPSPSRLRGRVSRGARAARRQPHRSRRGLGQWSACRGGTERTNRLIASACAWITAPSWSRSLPGRRVDALVAWEPRDRKRYILRMLGLERVDRAIEALRRDITDAGAICARAKRRFPP